MKKHIKSVHEKIKDLSCDECERTFSQQGDLKMHIKSIHEKIKDFLTRNNVKWGLEDGTNLFENIDELTEEDIVEKMCGYVDSEK